jgi:hypothetical protein
MFVHNRIQSIRQALQVVNEGEENIPLFDVDVTLNTADLVRKPRKISIIDIAPSSKWMNGLDWMRLPTEDLPRSQYVTPPSSDIELLASE